MGKRNGREIPVVLFCVVAGLAAALSANPLLTAASLWVLPVFFALLWRPGAPPLLLAAVLQQWLQVTMKVFHADFSGVPVESFRGEFEVLQKADQIVHPETLPRAILLGLVGLIALAVGIRAGLRHVDRAGLRSMHQQLESFSLRRLFVAYVCMAVVSVIATRAAWIVPGLTQLLFAIGAVKWPLFFLLSYAVLSRGEKLHYLGAALGIELVLGIGFFSGFKMGPILVLIALIGTWQRRAKGRRVLVLMTMMTLLVTSLAAWMSIREDFRTYVSGGSQEQMVLVPRAEQLREFGRLVRALDREDARIALEALASRISYIDYFGAVLERVPKYMPHENGALWAKSLEHAMRPRLFFPDKPVLWDSELTQKYTGRATTWARFTSISMGYMADSYIDFGIPGIVIISGLLGLMWGLICAYLVSSAQVRIVGYAFAVLLFDLMSQFGIQSNKLMGGVVITFAFALVMVRWVMPAIMPLLLVPRSRYPAVEMPSRRLRSPAPSSR